MQNKKRNKRTYWIIGAVVLLVGAVGAVLLLRQPAQTAVATGDTVTAFIGDLSAQASAGGAIESRRVANLSAETPGTVTAVYVRVGDTVAAGDVLVELDDSDLALNVANADQTVRLRQAALDNLLAAPEAADLAAAEAAVVDAQANLDELRDGPREEQVAISEASVRASQASLSSAAAELARTQDSITDAQILAAEAALTSARAQLDRAEEANQENPTAETDQTLREAQQAVADAQATLDDLRAGPDVAAAQSSVVAADARLEGSEATLNQTLAGATAVEIAAAEQQLAQAQATLADLEEGATDEEIATAEAELAQAQLTLADAQAQLEAATITAPFAGVVTAVSVAAGELAGGTVVSLLDVQNLELVLAVDEIDIGSIEVGQAATITLETWPDAAIPGEVIAIAPGANSDPTTALVTYDVHLALGETDLPVRVGMTANADLVTARRSDVLLVPNAAINVDRQAGTYSVNLLVDGTAQEVPVAIGLRDNEFTQITDGLSAGDALLVTNGAPVESFQPGPQGG